MKPSQPCLFWLLLILVSAHSMAQPPEAFNYQAILRDASGELFSNETVELEVALIKDTPEGEAVFTEIHSTQTNEFGLINLQIGSIQSLENIPWSAHTFFIRIKVNGDLMGVSQLLSVPYALHAHTSADAFSGNYDDLENLPDLSDMVGATDPQEGDMLYYSGQEWESIPLGEEGQILSIIGGIPQWSSVSEPGTVTDIDGNVYSTVIFGNQEWMVENLRTTRYNNGDEIPTGLDNTEWGNTTQGAFAVFDHQHDDAGGIDSEAEMTEAYGKLYNWYATTDERGLCPSGWQVPSDNHWTFLRDYLLDNHPEHDEDNLGNALKSCRRVNSPLGGDCDTEEHPRWDEDDWTGDDHYGTDDFGFGGLPAGSRHNSGFYYGIGMGGYWWSSSQNTPETAWYRGLFYNYGGLNRDGNFDKADGFSVRCVRLLE